jgi:hypothetical protein
MSSLSKETLKTRLENLPQELYDEIFDYTFTPDGSAITVGTKYKPPSTLHVNQKTREKVAIRYYSSTKFTFDKEEAVLGKWLRCLQGAHRDIIGLIHFDTGAKCGYFCGRWAYFSLFGEKARAVVRILEDLGYDRARTEAQRPMVKLGVHEEFKDKTE